MNRILYKPIIVISAVLGMFIMIELVALGGITWRNLHRINSIKQDIDYGHQLQQLIFELYLHHLQSIVNLPGSSEHDPELLNKIIQNLQQHYPDAAETRLLIDKSRNLLSASDTVYQKELMDVLQLAGVFFNQQITEEEELLSQVFSDSELELNFAIIFPVVVFLSLLLLDFNFFRKKIMMPLEALKQLLSRLVDGDMQPIRQVDIEPALQPLFTSYNRLVFRLKELELEHENHRQLLEQEVRNATHTLLEQSRSLARADRLAAVGELAASAAHELRNPLAGIQAALKNMLNESTDPDFSERLGLVVNETKRIDQRLNQLLALSRHTPEPSKAVNLSIMTQELLTLIKYQTESHITMNQQILTDIEPVLPETELRQALLNLLMNAAQQISEQGGAITVTVSSRSNRLLIAVHDTGPGFPDRLLEDGVRPFVSSHEQGTGLGLAMVRRFARSLDGDLILQNDDQGHACATLIIPV